MHSTSVNPLEAKDGHALLSWHDYLKDAMSGSDIPYTDVCALIQESIQVILTTSGLYPCFIELQFHT